MEQRRKYSKLLLFCYDVYVHVSDMLLHSHMKFDVALVMTRQIEGKLIPEPEVGVSICQFHKGLIFF